MKKGSGPFSVTPPGWLLEKGPDPFFRTEER